VTDTLDPEATQEFTVASHVFEYVDPYISDALDSINREIEAMVEIATAHYGESASDRKRTSAIDLDNPATRRLLEQAPTCAAWVSTIPSAAALHPLYDPDTPTYTNGEPLCDEIRSWFRNLADAHGIRSRAEVMKQILANGARTAGRQQQWLSLACGAAQPLFDTMEALRQEGIEVPHATLADLDTGALRLAHSYARSHQLVGNIALSKMNVLNRAGLRPRGTWLGLRDWSERFDVVDAIGLLEYLKPEDWLYSYRGLVSSKRRMAGATTFLRNAFECVAPGGQLVVGNMLDTHPQLDFTLNVVQWPHIQPRSIPAMLDLFTRANFSGHLDIYTPTDGVYAIYVVTKAQVQTEEGSVA